MELGVGFYMSILVALVGVIGTICAFAAAVSIRREQNILDRANILFSDPAAVHDAFAESVANSIGPGPWLESRGVKIDSHAGDYITTVWNLRKKDRFASLSELAPLYVVRERAQMSVVLTRGISGTLLVCGIAGTLLAIFPILGDFTLSDLKSGAAGVTDSAQSARDLQLMIHKLGHAFEPSIAAMLFTILVTFVRTFYTQRAYKFRRDLDRFAHETLLNFFRPKSFGEELADMEVKLGSLVDLIANRDSNFASAVQSLNAVLTDIKGIGANMRTAAEKAVEAVNRMGKESGDLINGLDRHLGKKSDLVKAINRFGLAAESSDDSAKTLKSAAESVETVAAQNAATMQKSAQALDQAVANLPEQIKLGWTEGGTKIVTESVAAFKEATKLAAEDVSQGIADSVTKAGEPIVKAMQSNAHLADQAVRSLADTSQKQSERIQSQVDAASKLLSDGTESLKGAVQTLEGAAVKNGTIMQDSASALEHAVSTLPDQVATGWEKSGKQIVDSTAAALQNVTEKTVEGLGNTLAETLHQVASPIVGAMETSADKAAQAVQTLERVAADNSKQLQEDIGKHHVALGDTARKIVEDAAQALSESVAKASSAMDASASSLRSSSETLLAANNATNQEVRTALGGVTNGFEKNLDEKLRQLEAMRKQVSDAQSQIVDVADRIEQGGVVKRTWNSLMTRLKGSNNKVPANSSN